MVIKKLFSTLGLLAATAFGLHAQVHEALTPLQINIEQYQPQTRAADLYIYLQDTLSLPVKDDFSTNKFRKYTAQPTDPNVTTQQYFHLLDAAFVPFPPDASFSKYQTYRIKVDTVGNDTSYYIPLPGQTIHIDSMSTPEVDYTSPIAYPCYDIRDSSLINPSDVPDTIYRPTCTWYQDSVYVHTVSPIDQATAIWINNYAYRNYQYAHDPPTLGVVTFDGLSYNGYPYNFSSSIVVKCDSLTTKPIDLSGLTAADSVYLSFFYQAGGLGDVPETGDSLTLEYYTSSGVWKHAWGVPGPSAGTRFKQVMLHISEPQFLHAGFRLRFVNYTVPSGSIDHWHIDYVFLDRLRSKNDTVGGLSREDVAFQYQASTLLNNRYTSMPLPHFETNPAGFMRDTLTVFKRNNDVGANIVGGLGLEVSREGAVQETHVFTGVVETSPANSDYTTLYHLDTLGLVYDTTGLDTCAVSFETMFFHNTTPDFCKDNDTMRLQQIFSNYYAYDDGTAEYAYGPIGLAGYETLLAVKFVLAKPDVLDGVAIHFSPSVVNNDNQTFNLTVWDNTGSGGTPGSIIYQETVLYDVVYGTNASNKFHVYHFSSPVNVSGTVFIGWKQTNINQINVGFDRNNNNRDRIFYKVGALGWTNTSYKGSVMLRPVFDMCDTDVVSVEAPEAPAAARVVLYPNPAGQTVNIGSSLPVQQVDLFDLTGQQVLGAGAVNTLSLDGLSTGIYVVRVKTSAGFSVHRLVVEQ